MRAPFSLSQFCPGGISYSGKPTSLPGIAKELLPAGAGGSVPWRPSMAERAGECLLPSHSSAPEESHAPAFPTLLPGIAKEMLPAGALRSNVAGTCGSPTNAPSKNAVQGFVIGSACAAAFFHRGIIPLLTLFFSASGSQKTAVTPLEEGRQMPSGLPPPAGESVSPAGRKFFQIRAARHTVTIHSSLFTILFPLAPSGGTPHPGKPTLLPGNTRELLPAGAGGSVPWRPSAVMRECRALFPPHSFACRA